MKTKTGRIYVIDGNDGSGKATQTKLLKERLQAEGYDVETLDFPRYKTNVLGGLIRECLDGKHGNFLSIDPRIVSVLYAADRFESAELIRGWLEQGKIVILDRYVSANQIHQGGKIRDEKARKEFLEWLDRLEFEIFKIPRPTAIIYLHVPVETSMQLAAARAMEKGGISDTAESDEKHQRESQESALSIVQSSNSWFRVNCGDGKGGLLSREAIHESVYKVVSAML